MNVFTAKKFVSFPNPAIDLCVFSQLVNGYGGIDITLVVVRLATEQMSAQVRNTIRFGDRLQEVRYLMKLERFVFPEAGSYEFTLYAGTEPVARTRLRLTRS